MTDLIHRVNVGDSLTRSAAARPDKIAVFIVRKYPGPTSLYAMRQSEEV